MSGFWGSATNFERDLIKNERLLMNIFRKFSITLLVCCMVSQVAYCAEGAATATGVDRSVELVKLLEKLADRINCISESSGDATAINSKLAKCAISVERILESGDLDLTSEDARVSFVGAARFADEKIMELFIKKGFDINTCNESQQTAAMLSAMHGNVSTLWTLIKHGADFTLKDKRGKTAADFALCVPKNLGNPLAVFTTIPIIVTASARTSMDPLEVFNMCHGMSEAAANMQLLARGLVDDVAPDAGSVE